MLLYFFCFLLVFLVPFCCLHSIFFHHALTKIITTTLFSVCICCCRFNICFIFTCFHFYTAFALVFFTLLLFLFSYLFSRSTFWFTNISLVHQIHTKITMWLCLKHELFQAPPHSNDLMIFVYFAFFLRCRNEFNTVQVSKDRCVYVYNGYDVIVFFCVDFTFQIKCARNNPKFH